MRLPALALTLVLAAAACGDSSAPPTTAPGEQDTSTASSTTSGGAESATGAVPVADPAAEGPAVELVPVATGLKRPTYLTSPPGDERLFVLLKNDGQILVIEDGEVLSEPFLDVAERLAENGDGDERGRGERGMLALAFHPDYADNGRFFLYYADRSGISELVEYRVSEDPNRADADSAVVLRTFGPTIRHYGGTLEFAPDGTLWLSIGEGGNRNDAAKTDVPRGGILRFDVSTPGVATGAEGNPFATDGSADLWAIGMRNPWRWSIDGDTGLLYLGDVGHQTIEEINVQAYDAAGLDYGWPVLEGTSCYSGSECDATGTVTPVLELAHSDGACSVIGGYVYRGEAIPDLAGTYFYSDYCGGWIDGFRWVDDAPTEARRWFDRVGSVTSFGTDGAGELYVVTIDGTVYQLVPAAS